MDTVNEKSADFKAFVERNPYISAGARGAAMGAGAFATIAAVKEVIDLIDDVKKKKKAKKPPLSSDTLVITLPDKKEEKLASARDLALEEAKKHDKKPTDGTWKQARNLDGTFASGWELDLEDHAEEKTAQEKVEYSPPWYQEGLDMGLSGATGVVGAGLGWLLAQKTYDYLKQKRLKKEIAAAQKEYIDFLVNEKDAQLVTGYNKSIPHKIWSGGVSILPTDRESLRETGTAMTGAVTSTAILLALASTYLTKKFLDQKFNDLDTKTTIDDIPKVNNIVFKTASAEEIPLTPADALAMVKFAEIMMEADSILMEKEAQFKGWVFDQAVNNPKLRYGQDDYLREQAMNGLFAGMGMKGDDPKNWTYNGNVDKNKLSATQLRDLRNVHTLFNEDNDAAMKLFMSDRYKAQRENMARQYLNNWYGNSWLGKTFGTDTGFGQLMQRLLGWFGNYYANSSWGGKNMYNKMMTGIDNVGSGANAINPYPLEEQGPEPETPAFDDPSEQSEAALEETAQETPTSETNTPEQVMDKYIKNPKSYDNEGFLHVEGSPYPAAVRKINGQPENPWWDEATSKQIVANKRMTPEYLRMTPEYLRKESGFLDSKLLAAASRLAVTTDTRNDTLDDKLDKLLSAQQNNSSSSNKNKKNDTGIKIIAADKNARDALKDKRKVIEQVLRDLKEQGTI